jgi:hypothetical protein
MRLAQDIAALLLSSSFQSLELLGLQLGAIRTVPEKSCCSDKKQDHVRATSKQNMRPDMKLKRWTVFDDVCVGYQSHPPYAVNQICLKLYEMKSFAT